MSNQVILTIAHNLFLSKEERYKLKTPQTEVKTIGIALPVWVKGSVTSEPAEEVIARYVIRNYPTPGIEPIHITHDGFILSFEDSNLWTSLLDVKDGGSECIYLTYHGKVSLADQEMMIINYINIQDISVLSKRG